MRASERAYATLREDIVDWRLPPGSVLAEVEQSERLGVSRTPLREALGRLASDGLVAQLGGRGLVVTAVSLGDVTALFELRQALEQEAARLAAVRRDPAVFRALQSEFRDAPVLLRDTDPGRVRYYELVARFDDAMDVAAGNSYLVGALRSLRPHLVRIRRVSQDNAERLQEAAREHLLIADAILAGDAELAAAATRVHLHQSLQSVLASAERLTTASASTEGQS
jgi:DNA-binding GntR family transcriptional regulator